MELVTGRKGTPHITSQQDRMKNQGIWGDQIYILNTGQMLEPQVQSSNEIRIRDGALMAQGALSCVKVNSYDSVAIQNGSQGMKRIDLICWQYTYDADQDVESAEWVVIQGTPAASDPQQPTYTEGDIQQGDELVQVPIFAVHLDGINVTGVDVIPEVMPDIPTLNAYLAELSSYSEEELADGITITRCGRHRVLQISNVKSPVAGDIVRLPDGDMPSGYVMGSATYRGQTQGDYFISITPKGTSTPGKVGLFRGNNDAVSASGKYIVAHIDWYVSP